MDPNATYILILDALKERDWDEAYEAAHNLRVWLNQDGFVPTGWTRDNLRRFLAEVKSACLHEQVAELHKGK